MQQGKSAENTKSADVIAVEQITQSILVFRGHKVLLDTDLAGLYGVPTKRLNEQVKRNALRFPEDFLFRLTSTEVEVLNRSQFATGSLSSLLATLKNQRRVRSQIATSRL